MPILGDRTHLAGFVGRRTRNNALLLNVKDDQGAELFEVRQKGSLGVMLGFRNGGGGDFTVLAPGEELPIEIAQVTTVGTVGTIESAADHGTLKDAGGTVLATIGPHLGDKLDDPWVHAVTDPSGAVLGSISRLKRTPTRTAESDALSWIFQLEYPEYTQLKAPTFGVFLELERPVGAALGDLLVAALVDTAMVPRGYRAKD